MADELTLRFYADYAKNDVNIQRTIDDTVTITGNTLSSAIQTIGTSAENLILTDVATCGYCWAKNIDATNYVEIGLNSGGFVAFLKLKAGEAALFRLATGFTPQAKANTSSINLEYTIISD